MNNRQRGKNPSVFTKTRERNNGNPPSNDRDGFNRSAQHLSQFIGWRLKAKRFPWPGVQFQCDHV
jgi:hypothetical protein